MHFKIILFIFFLQWGLLLFCTTCLYTTTSVVYSAAIDAPYGLITLEDVSNGDRSYLQSFADQMQSMQNMQTRNRRSGTVDVLGPIKHKIANGVKSKLGLIAQGSAAAVSHLSSKISSGGSGGGGGGGGHYHHYHHETPHVS